MSTESAVTEMTDLDYPGEVAAVLASRVGPLEGIRQTFSLGLADAGADQAQPGRADRLQHPAGDVPAPVHVRVRGAIGGSPHQYLMFALPGIIVQNSLFTTLNTATGLSTDLEKGFFDRLRSLPIARFAPLAGHILADIAKQAWAVAMLLAIGALLGFRIGTNPLAVLAAVGLILVSTLALSWALMLVAMLAANPEKVQVFGFVVLFPITFTSDAFVRTASMPGWLQAWSKANPVSLIADAMRGLVVSGPVTRPLVESLLYAVAFTVVFGPLAVRAFRRRV